jgi:hypothetical protein
MSTTTTGKRLTANGLRRPGALYREPEAVHSQL